MYFDQLLGAAHYVNFISNHNNFNNIHIPFRGRAQVTFECYVSPKENNKLYTVLVTALNNLC